MTKTKIQVTAENIKKGKREDPCNCPVALALKKAGYKGISVDGSSIQFDDINGNELTIGAGCRIEDFVEDFDAGEKVKPFNFNMPIPPTYAHVDLDEVEAN